MLLDVLLEIAPTCVGSVLTGTEEAVVGSDDEATGCKLVTVSTAFVVTDSVLAVGLFKFG